MELEVGVTIMFFWGWGSWGNHCGLVGLKVAEQVRATGKLEPCDLGVTTKA